LYGEVSHDQIEAYTYTQQRPYKDFEMMNVVKINTATLTHRDFCSVLQVTDKMAATGDTKQCIGLTDYGTIELTDIGRSK